MKPMFAAAQGQAQARSSIAEGEDERVLRAAQVVLEEGIARPILIGRPQVIESAHRSASGCDLGRAAISSSSTRKTIRAIATMSALFHSLVGRNGVTPDAARTLVRTNTTVIARAGGASAAMPTR